MLRGAFLKRMALAAAACAFIDVKWPTAATDDEIWAINVMWRHKPQAMTMYLSFIEQAQ